MTALNPEPAAQARRQRVLSGAALVTGAGLMFALAGMSIKMAGETLGSTHILFWRNVLSLLILTPWILWNWPHSLRPAHTGLIVLRGVSVVAALLCYYYAVTVIPLADALLFNFSAPIFVPVLGLLLFGFALNRAVLLAVIIGFIGVALILKPGTNLFQPVALIALASGALGGLSVVAIWRMPANESATRIAVFFALIGIAITSVAIVADPRLPPPESWSPLVMLGVFSTAAHLLYVRGCLIAPTDQVSTLTYTSVFFGAAIGWMIWDERVDWFMTAGTVLVVGASAISVHARRGTAA